MTQNTTPIVSPLLQLLHSRKFVLTFVGVVLDVVIVFLPPDTAPRILAMREELIGAVSLLFITLIGGIAVEDAAAKHATPPALIGISGEPLRGETKFRTGTHEQTLKPHSGDWQS